MRKRFEPQLSLGAEPIEEVKIYTKSRDEFPPLLVALQEIFKNVELNEQIFNILEERITKGKKKTGRPGMDLWHILVLSIVRLSQNTNYDKVLDLANNHKDLRKILGVYSFVDDKKFELQTVRDNLELVTEDELYRINAVISQWGLSLFNKKKDQKQILKTDSYVLETNVHFPTDYNLLWDSARKCVDTISKILKKNKIDLPGWRNIHAWRKTMKNLSRQMGQVSKKGGKNKINELQYVANQYINKSRILYDKVQFVVEKLSNTPDFSKHLKDLQYYAKMLNMHKDLIYRRIIKRETIPAEDKIYSIFLEFTEWINKGKLHPNVELGKKILITTNQDHLILDYQIMDNQSDSQTIVPLYNRMQAFIADSISSWSFDKGFTDGKAKKHLESSGIKVIIPKKGKKNKLEQATEQTKEFKSLRNKHSAIESNINQLEHNGLDRCPDKSRKAFNRYVGLGVLSYNLHRIGKKLQEIQRVSTALIQAA